MVTDIHKRIKEISTDVGELLDWLKEAARTHCPACGKGREGCSTTHWIQCPVQKIIRKVEGENGLL